MRSRKTVFTQYYLKSNRHPKILKQLITAAKFQCRHNTPNFDVNTCGDFRDGTCETGNSLQLSNGMKKLDSSFQRWEYLARNVTYLVNARLFRQEVDEKTDEELYLAHLQLSIIAAGYVWEGHEDGDEQVAKVLPKCIAVPFHSISQRLGIKPVISYPSFILANWKFKDDIRSGEVIASENIDCLDCIQSLPGSNLTDWFTIVSVQTEFEFAHGIQYMEKALYYADNSNCDELKESLKDVTSTIKNMTKAMNMMNKKLPAGIFYNHMRPFMRGWGGKDSPLPDGLVYEAVSDKPIQLNGGSAAQSPTIQSLDALLGVVHNEGAAYLLEMRNYMRPKHKQLIEEIQNRSLIRKVVSENLDFPGLVSAYNGCIDALVQFRGHHMKIIKTFILDEKYKGQKLHSSDENRGAGGVYLKGLDFFQRLQKSTMATKILI